MSFIKHKNLPPKTNETSKKPFYKRRGWKIFFSILAVIVVIAFSFVFYLFSKSSKVFENGISSSALIKTLTGGQTLKGESEDRVNVLLMGMGGPSHPGGFLTDSLMLVSIKPSTHQIAMISIPRDLYVPIPGHGQDKINSAFANGRDDYRNKNCGKKNTDTCEKEAMAAGANLSVRTVSNVLNLPIQYYVTVEFSGFEKIVDDLGGIDVNVDKAIYDPSFPADNMVGYTTFKISAGPHHMDGVTALKYARSRETTSDFDRAARQQKILLAAKDKAKSINLLTDPKKMLDIFNSLTDSVYTNFSPAELRTLADMAKNVDTSKAISKVLTNGPEGELVDSNNGIYYLKPKTGNFKQIQDIVNKIFETTVTRASANIEIVNGGGLSNNDLIILSRELESNNSMNANIVNISSASSPVAKTVIYDYSNGNKVSILSILKNRFSAYSVKKTKTSQNTIDFSIIIGRDFKISS